LTNQFGGSLNETDQPWLMTDSDPSTPSQTNTYVGYDDFFNPSQANTRVSTAPGSLPPDFATGNESADGFQRSRRRQPG
jgi:hypothetical protein